MRIVLAVVACVLVAELSGCAAHRRTVVAGAPVVVSEDVRASVPNDYMRVSFLPPNTKVTSLSRPGALRAFATATALYEPPLKLAGFPYYSGLVNNDDLVLVAMRCRPQQPEKVDAVLATWPNVFAAILRDVPVAADACAGNPSGAPTEMACYAKNFQDAPGTSVPTLLVSTFSYAGRLFDPDHKPLAQWLQQNYGIYPAFAGTGYSVEDSYSLSTEPMTAQEVLVKSASSEYVLKNVSLVDAGCRCIAVAPYPGRANDPLDPEFIEKAGGDGVCKDVKKLLTEK